MSDDVSHEPEVARLRVHPIKSLDPHPVGTATIGVETGGLVGDRTWAIVDRDGDYVNGKRTRAVHQIRTRLVGDRIVLSRDGKPDVTWTPGSDTEDVERWLSDHFGESVELVGDRPGGHPDDTARPGPTVISTGTIREIASWYDDIDEESVRRRFRANIEIGCVPPFWEDRLVDDHGRVVEFSIAGETIEGVNPCSRCVVPTRDPDTGEDDPRFREIFVENRQRTEPPWLASDRFDHPFRVMVNTRVPADSRGETIAVGDPVAVAGSTDA